MSERTITLTSKHMTRLHAGKRVWLDDSDNREVLLLPDGADPGDVYDGALVGVVYPVDLVQVEQFPEGYAIADTTGTTGWTIRKEQS